MKKKRLDDLLVERELVSTRESAQALILAGKIWTGEIRLDKPGVPVNADIELRVEGPASRFVSRAGDKLQHGLDHFGLNVKDGICLDVGASTGGFTDCLLQSGAEHVFAVDVGYGQLDVKLRSHPRVTNVERCNARTLTVAQLNDPRAEQINFVVIDVSFISLRLVVEPIAHSFLSAENWLLLFKPQFEVAAKFVEKGGIVHDTEAVQRAMEEFDVWMRSVGFFRRGVPEPSPLKGKKSGNLEYLLLYERSHATSAKPK